jgi:UDPglucose 6-dehydrogenase
MNVTVFGAGYVGLVTAACLADVGNDVLGLDLDPARVDLLNAGGMPIHEPGLDELLARNRLARRLRFTTDAAYAVAHAEVQFIAVGTPAGENGGADLSHALAAGETIARHMLDYKLVVIKSTVPPGTAERLRAAIASTLKVRGLACDSQAFDVASNPEFLKEGAAVEDFMRPERIIVGTPPGPAGERARAMMRRLYEPFNRHHDRILHMDTASAEFTKYAANAMLATRISFMNELANLAGELGVDIEQVRRGIGSDRRIGYSFLYAGTGYGGSCFPKDVRALMHTAAACGRRLRVLEAVEAVNEGQKNVLVEKICKRFGADGLDGKLFALWGLAFKPNTDDMREAPSRVIIRALLERGARLSVHDPIAMPEARRVLAQDLDAQPALLDRIRYVDTPMHAVAGADALVIVTEWQAFKSPSFTALKKAMKSPLIFDGRNLYEPSIREQGFEYHAIGR